MYHKGAMTADQLVVECLRRVDPKDPAPLLGALPEEILDRMLDFARCFSPDGMITNHGPLPRVDQVEAARCWIEGARARRRRRSEPSRISG
jgi:hypothetical protein